MGTKQSKGEGMLTSVELVIRQNPDYSKQIRQCMKKWNKRTSGKLQWPEKGTFDAACSREVEANIKHYKAKDTSNSREGKRAREREVLRWFRDVARQYMNTQQMPVVTKEKKGERKQRTVPTAPMESMHPPPYAPQMKKQVGQYPLVGAVNRAEGEVTGKFTLNWDTLPTKRKTSDKDEAESVSSIETVSSEERHSEADGTQKDERRRRRGSEGAVGNSPVKSQGQRDLLQHLMDVDDEEQYREVQHRQQRKSAARDNKEYLGLGQRSCRRRTAKDTLSYSDISEDEKDTPPLTRKAAFGLRGLEEETREKIKKVHDLEEEGRELLEQMNALRNRHKDMTRRRASEESACASRTVNLQLTGTMTEENELAQFQQSPYRKQADSLEDQERRPTPPNRGMTLRSGREVGENEKSLLQMPLVIKGQNRTPQYVPWSFCDMVGLAGRLPDLNEGANRWITALEESTAGVTLALGDIKALLMRVAGKGTTEEIFQGADMELVMTGNEADHVGFNGHRNRVWAELRGQFPEKMDPSKLEGEKIKDEECPAKFLRSFQNRWREETGSAWNTNSTTQSLFKVMVKKSHATGSAKTSG